MLITELSEWLVFYLTMIESKPHPCQSTGSKYIVLTSAKARARHFI